MTTGTPTNGPATGGGVDALDRAGGVVHLDEEVLSTFAASLDGTVIGPQHDDYEVARRVWNGMVDVSPALIVGCASTEDVQSSVRFVREHDLRMSVRGGGHNAAGVAVCEGGLVVDLSRMRSVEVDPSTGIVRAQGGVTIGELDAATQPHGLVVPQGVVTETGIAGLTLGGGLGWLRRRFGLACDNLVRAEVVTAEGEVVVAGEDGGDGDPDLLWGLRGGGGNFGIVTTFELRAHPVGPDVFFAVVVHAGDDADVLRAFRGWAGEAAPDISGMAVVAHIPELDEVPADLWGRPGVILGAVHAGSPAEGESALASLRAIGTPVADLSGTLPYVEVQQFFDEDYPKWEKRYYWTSSYVTDLADDLVDHLVALNAEAPSLESTVDVWQLGGAIADVAPEATAFGDRSAPFMLGIEANWDDPSTDEENVAWARRVREAAEPWATGTRYANFPGLYESDEEPDFFGTNHSRLVDLKARFDPDNLFDRNHNVAPRPSD